LKPTTGRWLPGTRVCFRPSNGCGSWVWVRQPSQRSLLESMHPLASRTCRTTRHESVPS